MSTVKAQQSISVATLEAMLRFINSTKSPQETFYVINIGATLSNTISIRDK